MGAGQRAGAETGTFAGASAGQIGCFRLGGSRPAALKDPAGVPIETTCQQTTAVAVISTVRPCRPHWRILSGLRTNRSTPQCRSRPARALKLLPRLHLVPGSPRSGRRANGRLPTPPPRVRRPRLVRRRPARPLRLSLARLSLARPNPLRLSLPGLRPLAPSSPRADPSPL